MYVYQFFKKPTVLGLEGFKNFQKNPSIDGVEGCGEMDIPPPRSNDKSIIFSIRFLLRC